LKAVVSDGDKKRAKRKMEVLAFMVVVLCWLLGRIVLAMTTSEVWSSRSRAPCDMTSPVVARHAHAVGSSFCESGHDSKRAPSDHLPSFLDLLLKISFLVLRVASS
jgi:hypothetical protein